MYRKILEKRMTKLEKKREDLTAKALSSEDAAEVRSINEQLAGLNEEIEELREEIDMLSAEGGQEERQQAHTGMQTRGGNPLAAYSLGGAQGGNRRRDRLRQRRIPHSVHGICAEGNANSG